MLQVSELYIYPIKSLGGISLDRATLTDRGFEYDRRWMLVDADGRFLSQRELPQMALLQAGVDAAALSVRHKERKDCSIEIPMEASGESCEVTVWDDRCKGLYVDTRVDEWFSDILSFRCRMVYMPDSSRREVESGYARNGEITSFSDAYPLLMIGDASLKDLNSRLEVPVPMNRFRPNIVFTGGEPFQEDKMKHFRIGDISFFGVKPCARCMITTIDQSTAAQGKEPLKTLSQYRRDGQKVLFGQNLLFRGQGSVAIGDPISLA